MGLRQLATGKDAMPELGRLSAFGLAGQWLHNVDHQDLQGDRGPHGFMPPRPLCPMDLIDDACAFETIADKLDRLTK